MGGEDVPERAYMLALAGSDGKQPVRPWVGLNFRPLGVFSALFMEHRRED
jgi:hypothetical protein